MAKQNEASRRKPVMTLGPVWTGAGHVQVAVWENESGDRPSYSVTCKRRYKQNGDYKDAQTFFAGDLLALAELLREAWAWIAQAHKATGSDEL